MRIALFGFLVAVTVSGCGGSTAKKVCLVTSGPAQDGSYNQIVYDGVTKAAAAAKWTMATTEVMDGQETAAFASLGKGGCELIIEPGFPLADSIAMLATDHPTQKIQILDFDFDPPFANVWSENYASDQASFLAGYLAASVSKTGKVGVFGGLQIPPVTLFMDGFALGVAYYNQQKSKQVLVLGWDVASQMGTFIDDFGDEQKGQDAATGLLDNGADIVFPVAGGAGFGAIPAVKAHAGSLVIGVDADWALESPGDAAVILTSVLKRLDVSVDKAIRATDMGQFAGGPHVGGLADDSVQLAPFHAQEANVPAAVQTELTQLRTAILGGTVKTQP